MSATAELNVLDCGGATVSKRDDVMELEKAALGAPASLAHKRALTVVAFPDGTPYGRRDVP